MSHSHKPRAHTRRSPLGDVTRSVNNGHYASSPLLNKESFSLSHSNNQISSSIDQFWETGRPTEQRPRPSSPTWRQPICGSPGSAAAANPRLSKISKDDQVVDSNRNSQISTTSTNASGRRKILIGPWHLGKTLGKGSTARVRLARHAVTGQLAAIKIVQKKDAQLSQAGSLAALDQKDASIENPRNGARKMPYGIEREVAIMKLIQHPHIMKLYDIWENRTEIYLVLEYIANGELFDHISNHGSLDEEESLKYFRQILSAVGYCHSFNICHRDLKPENILLTEEHKVKVADFGMAALHQTPEHRLQTSCGSPHYAAPEVIRAMSYRGDKADIWSMGVILYASLAGVLPFDHADLPGLLDAIKKGRYKIPAVIGREAADLIRRMLQLDPRERITVSQMWRHPLLRKYDYLDDYGGGLNPRSTQTLTHANPVIRKRDIDRELLRHLRSMWHTFEENQIIELLLNNEPNDQKLFYDLLLKHRDAQLENYVPDIGHSTSDYHHGRPLAQVQKHYTRQFSQPNSKGHGRAVSRFTVLSNASRGRQSSHAETEATTQSYDPFRASRPQDLPGAGRAARTNVTVHDGKAALQNVRSTLQPVQLSTSNPLPGHRKRSLLAPPPGFASRSSLASSTRSRSSAHGRRVVAGHRRGVSFSHTQRVSGNSRRSGQAVELNLEHQNFERSSINAVVVDERRGSPDTNLNPPGPACRVRSRKTTAASSQLGIPVSADQNSRLWNDEVRQVSTSLAKTCEEAFNRTSMTSTVRTKVSRLEDSQSELCDSPISSFNQSNTRHESIPQTHLRVPIFRSGAASGSFDARPLPKPPARSESVNKELLEARKKVQLRKICGEDPPGYLDRMVSHIDHLMQPGSSPVQRPSDRRTISAPVGSRLRESGGPLPSIHESKMEEAWSERSSDFDNFIESERARVSAANCRASTPDPPRNNLHQRFGLDDRTSRRDERARKMIQVVPPSSPSPAKPPAPLNIRKKSSQGPPTMTGANGKLSDRERPPICDLRQQYFDDSPINTSTPLVSINGYGRDEDPFSDGNGTATVRKKGNWFKRNSKSSEDDNVRSFLGKSQPIPPLGPTQGSARHTVGSELPVATKKKSFGFGRLFGKLHNKQDTNTSIPEFQIRDDSASIAESIDEDKRVGNSGRTTQLESLRTRQIEPQRSWLARLFHVKPATRFICFSVSKRRARQEIGSLLKEWRKYGARDIVIDKERNIVFGRVGPKNYFQMKEVAFAAEILTVIEHGKRSHLSIARFTQEKGAASSFYKVAETLETVMKSRGMLVSDERKKRMIIKTLSDI